jgi:NADPH2 dehydrogenase
LARFFKFRSLEAIEAESARLGLDLRFSRDLGPLFQPVQVGGRRVGNSLCIHPMEGCDGELDGAPGELTYRRYRRFGAGGAKLIWGEAAAVVPEGRATTRQLLVAEQHAAALERLVRECRQAHREAFGNEDDLLLGLQLTHSGRYSYPRPLIACHDPLLDPRTVADRATGRKVDADYPLLDDDTLERLPDAYVAAARLCQRVGFDFVDVKQCHRYLLNELLAARNRPGKFGGGLENRTRLARTIIERIRAEVPGLLIACRLNGFDGIPFHTGPDAEGTGEPDAFSPPVPTVWGAQPESPLVPDLSEPLAWIGEMVRLGVCLLNLTLGNPYVVPHLGRPFEYPPPDGYQAPEHPLIGVDRHFRLTAEVQRAYPDLPVVGTGYSYLQEFFPQAGAANIRDGRVTFLGVGRASLSMPDFARLLQQTGQLERRRICRTFSYCTALMRAKHNELGQFASGCPPFDKEVYGPLWEQAKKKP